MYLRAAYTRSLGGVGFDQSFRLEPIQVAGFNQAYRGLIPMAVAGASSAERFETIHVAWEQKLASRTYAGFQMEWLNSENDRLVGSADLVGMPPKTITAGMRQNLRYRERNLMLTLNQLIGPDWAVGAAYRCSQSDLHGQYPDLASFNQFAQGQDYQAWLHQVDVFGLFNHRSGCFGRLDAQWNRQTNDGYTPALPGDDFWQFNVYVGYRFWQRKAEIKVGLLNLSDQNYQLNPLNLVVELPRERTLVLSLKLAF
jgi:hypothetical protein